MKLDWQIRAARLEDSEGLKNCMALAYSGYRQRMGGRSLPPMEVDYRAEIENYPSWVVQAEGRIVGGLIMVFDDDHASIANIAIHPDLQGQGVGGALMRFAESTAREHNFHEMRLATHVLLAENISLYRHLGWRETGRDESRVFMKKDL